MTINYLDSKRISALSTSGTGTTVTSSSINDVSHFETSVGLNHVIGEQITGGTLVGKTITSLSFYLYQLSTNSGVADTTFTFGIWNSSGVLQKEFGSVNRSSLPIGSAHGDAVKFTGTATNSGYELQTNDIIGLRTNSNPNDSGQWTVEIGMDTTNPYSDGQRALFIQDNSSISYTSARDIPFEAVYDQDIKPTNVEYNSILVEKDTGNRYWFDNTPTFEDDFSGADNWTDDGNDVVVNTGTNVIDWASLADGAEDLTYYDLTSVSDTKWVADFDITFDAVTSGSDTDGTYLVIALDSVTTVPNSSPHDALGIAYELDNTPNNNASIEVFSCDGLNLYDSMELNTPTGTVNVFTETAQASETQYVRMIRNVSTFTVEIYSDTTRETLVESNSVDANDGGTVSGLRYFKIATTRDNTGDHTFNGTIDNVKFYNNVTTPATWKDKYGRESLGSWTPASLSNLHSWFDFSDATTITKDASNRVSQVNDKSGNGNHLTQGTAGNQPLYVENDTEIGYGVLDTSGSRHMLDTFTTYSNQPTIISAMKFPAQGVDTRMMFWNTDDVSNRAFLEYQGNNDVLSAYGGGNITFDGAYLRNTWANVIAQYGSSGKIHINGVEKVTGSLGTMKPDSFRLSADYNVNYYGNTRFGEIIILDGVITDADRTNLQTYLDNKWGLS